MNKLAEGLNNIFGRIKSGDSFENAVKNATGKTVSEIVNAIDSGNSDATTFARELSIAAGNGAGSVIYGLANGSQALGGLPADGSTATDIKAATTLSLQVGAEAYQTIDLNLFSIGTKSLGLHDANILTEYSAGEAIESAKNALAVVSSIRSYYGAVQNRLESTVRNLDNVVENTQAAESKLRDTDMSKEMVNLSIQNILESSGMAMITQANQKNQNILSLIG